MYNSGGYSSTPGYAPPSYTPAPAGRGDQWSPNFAAGGYNSAYGKREAAPSAYGTPTMASKRSRVDESPAAPSKTLHIRNLPLDATEADLRGACSPFGPVEKVLILSGKKQGFVQMADITSATAVLNYYATNQAMIRTRPVYLQYSRRQEISSSSSSSRDSGDEPPNHILMVSVENVMYPITIDIMHQIFSKYGEVQKIILFNKSGFQALVQFGDLGSAVNARNSLQRQNIYSGCCTLNISFSTFPSITVKYNNDRSRDFTNPALPTGPNPSYGGAGGGYGGSPSYGGLAPAAVGWGASPYGMPGMPPVASGSKVLICSNFDPEQITPDIIFTLFGVYGDVIRVKILYTKRDTALIQFRDHDQAQTALTHLRHGISLWGRELKINFSKHSEISMPREEQTSEGGKVFTQDYTRDPRHRYKHAGSKNFQHICPVSRTLHLSNISGTATESQLVSMFTTYGSVTAFKFFENNHRMGLVEMSNQEEAILALIGLHCTEMDEGELRISFSKSTISYDHPSASVYVGGRKVGAEGLPTGAPTGAPTDVAPEEDGEGDAAAAAVVDVVADPSDGDEGGKAAATGAVEEEEML